MTAIDRNNLDICKYFPQIRNILSVVFVTIGPDCFSLHFFLFVLILSESSTYSCFNSSGISSSDSSEKYAGGLSYIIQIIIYIVVNYYKKNKL